MKTKTKIKTASASALLFSESVPHHLVAERAYAIWLARGQPDGSDYHHWVEAEQQLVEQRLEPGEEGLASRLTYWSDPFTTDIDRALDSIAPPFQQRSATSL